MSTTPVIDVKSTNATEAGAAATAVEVEVAPEGNYVAKKTDSLPIADATVISSAEPITLSVNPRSDRS